MAGWGLNEFGNYSEQLSHITLPVIPVPKCREDTVTILGDSAATRLLNANMFCAGHGAETKLEGELPRDHLGMKQKQLIESRFMFRILFLRFPNSVRRRFGRTDGLPREGNSVRYLVR